MNWPPTGRKIGLPVKLGTALHRIFENAAQRSAKRPRETDSKASWAAIFRLILASVYMVMVCPGSPLREGFFYYPEVAIN